MKQITAYFGMRNGGSGAKLFSKGLAAIQFLKNPPRNVTEIHLEDNDGNEVGGRWRAEKGDCDDTRVRWLWAYDTDLEEQP